jgi:ribonuclease HI
VDLSHREKHISSVSKKNYYAVAKGYKPGIYREWYGPEGAEAQVKGYSGAVYQGFRSYRDAQHWLQALSETPTPPTPKLPAGKAPRHKKTGGPQAALDAGQVVIYTDGACIDNPGPGGYGVVLLYKEHRKELSGGFRRTTNNRMELMACIAGLQALKRKSSVVIHSDSKYVVNGMTKGWAKKWRANNWQRSEKAKAQNADLWSQLLDLCKKHEVEFVWVKGHVGNPENEHCDRLSTQAARGNGLPTDLGFRRKAV